MESSKVTWLALLLAVVALAVSLWPGGDDKKKETRPAPATVATAPAQSAARPVTVAGELSATEKGYRFSELYFAGQEGNWRYAGLQANKLSALIQALNQKNPRRAESAAGLVDEDIPRLLDAVENQDGRAFDRALQELLDSCNACHEKEEAGYIRIIMPDQRVSPVRSP